MAKFKVKFDIETNGLLTSEEIKHELHTKIGEFTMYNEDDDEVEVTLKNFWETAMITEEIELTDTMEEVNKIAKLKEAMELILGREVFMPQVLKIKDVINKTWV